METKLTGWKKIHAEFGEQFPAGEFAAWLNGTSVKTTQEIAQAIFLERYNATRDGLIADARQHFASGFQGNTADEFHAAVLLAFGETLPEYPASLRAEHEKRTQAFKAGLAEFATNVSASAQGDFAREQILESGRQQADAAGR